MKINRLHIFSLKERLHFLFNDILLFYYKINAAYYEVKNQRTERRIKELRLILALNSKKEN